MNKKQFTAQVLEAEKSLYHIAKSILKNDKDCADAKCNFCERKNVFGKLLGNLTGKADDDCNE